MSESEFKNDFNKYRKERLLKECPMCSDLWHGYNAGRIDSQKEIQDLKGLIKELERKEDIFTRSLKCAFRGLRALEKFGPLEMCFAMEESRKAKIIAQELELKKELTD